MVKRFNEFIADIFQPKDFNGQTQCLACLSELSRLVATPSCKCNYAICPDCVAPTDASRKKCFMNCLVKNVSHSIRFHE
jgi:hypothetical protein